MTLPLQIAPRPHRRGWARSRASSAAPNLAAGLLASADGWNFPLALLRPLEPLFGEAPPHDGEKYLAGLRAEYFLGAGMLPAGGQRAAPLAWIGVELSNRGRNPFAEVRGGCWVPGQPSIGRGCELLRAAGADDSGALASLLVELGFEDGPGPALYFNFHYDQPEADCDRVYVLDAAARRLHGLALPCSALAPAPVK
jgi:hypothetical protein